MSNKESEQLEGTLNKIIFQNDTGFIIGNFTDKHNNNFTAIGNMINPQINMEYIFSGYWTENNRYGEQFKFASCETIMPVDTSGIFKYIVRICKYVGPAVGNEIVDKYGMETLSIMKNNPVKLANEIDGISLSRAETIQTALLENENNEKIMVQLEAILNIPGMRKNLPGELIKIYKDQAAEAVKGNPYILTQFHGIGFPLADRVALNLGYARDSIKRKEAATMHCMSQNMQEGSVWINEDVLSLKIQELIQVPDLKDGVQSLLSKDILVSDYPFYALAGPAADECFIAETITAIEAAA